MISLFVDKFQRIPLDWCQYNYCASGSRPYELYMGKLNGYLMPKPPAPITSSVYLFLWFYAISLILFTLYYINKLI